MSSTVSQSDKSDDLWISWEDYHRYIEQLAHIIYRSQWSFDTIVCIARGGLRVGDILSRIYDKPLAILAAQSYGGDTGRDRQDVIFSPSLATTASHLGPQVLLVDDLADSGQTLDQATQWLSLNCGQSLESLRTATLWCKSCSTVVPDYYVEFLTHNPWIHQPFERYDNYQRLNSPFITRS